MNYLLNKNLFSLAVNLLLMSRNIFVAFIFFKVTQSCLPIEKFNKYYQTNISQNSKIPNDT
jgi:hypothetical protein